MHNQLLSSRFMNDEFPIWIQRNVHNSDNTPEVHGHDFIELVCVVRGEAKHVFQGESYDIMAGDVFIINPGEVHTYETVPGKDIEIINCLFLPHLIKTSLLQELEISESMDYFYVHPFLNKNERFHSRLNLRGDNAASVLTILEVMLREVTMRQRGYETLIRLQMIELLVTLSRYYHVESHRQPNSHGTHHALVVLRICGYLERNYHQKITLETLSELFHLSTRQLNRIFRQAIGMSVIEKIQQIRLEKAKVLLSETDEKVIAVASLVGYDDPAFFSRLFTRQTGYSPGKYRSRSR